MNSKIKAEWLRGFGLLDLEVCPSLDLDEVVFPKTELENSLEVLLDSEFLLKVQVTAVAKKGLKDHLVCKLYLFFRGPGHKSFMPGYI